MKKLVWVFASLTLVGGAVWSVLSLYRWEWTRALYFGLVALVAEVALATGLVLRAIDRLGRQRDDDDEVRRILQDQRTPRQRFVWLEPEEVVSRTNVFITMLVGGGVVLSGLAWVLDRVASRTTTSVREGALVADLRRIAYPTDGLLVDDVTAIAQSVPSADAPELRALLGRRGR